MFRNKDVLLFSVVYFIIMCLLLIPVIRPTLKEVKDQVREISYEYSTANAKEREETHQAIKGMTAMLNDAKTESIRRADEMKNREEGERKSPKIPLSKIAYPQHGDNYARIKSDTLDLNVGLYYGDDSKLLKKGAGQYAGSKIPGEGGQIIIAGHNVSDFNPLKNAKVGDRLQIEANYGDFEYEISELKIVNRSDTSSYNLNLDHEQLILYTCYPFTGPPGKVDRLFAYCEKISGPVLTK